MARAKRGTVGYAVKCSKCCVWMNIFHRNETCSEMRSKSCVWVDAKQVRQTGTRQDAHLKT